MQKEFTIHVLGFQEDGLWCALALDLSLRGYGETFEEAQKDLQDAVEAQLTFAHQHDTMDEIWQPAEAHYHVMYQQARRQALELAVLDHEADLVGLALGYVPLPQSQPGEFTREAAVG